MNVGVVVFVALVVAVHGTLNARKQERGTKECAVHFFAWSVSHVFFM